MFAARQRHIEHASAAWDEYNSLTAAVEAIGYGDLIRRYSIPNTASTSEVKAATAQLREAYDRARRNNFYVTEMD